MKLQIVVGALLVMGSAFMEHQGADALRINIQPRNMLQPRFHQTSLMSPSQFSSVVDDLLFSSIFDDPFPRFSWPTSSLQDNLIGFVPRNRQGQSCSPQTTQIKADQKQKHEAAEKTRNMLIDQEKELELKEYELKREREALERQKQAEKVKREEAAREQRLQREIRERREQIQRAEERRMQEQERRREESARREREWQEKQRKLKEQKEEEKRRKEETKRRNEETMRRKEEMMRRKEEMEREARSNREWQQRREDEMNRQKRESQRQQQGQRHNPREQAQQRSNRQHQDSFHGRQREQGRRQAPPKLEIASIQVQGYNPEDISIVTQGNKMTISGLHVCGCDESCFEREFQRVYTLPHGAETTTLKGHIDENGILTVRGEKNIIDKSFIDSSVPVDGYRLSPRNDDSFCGGRKGGIKLKKMNKSTGKVFEDVPMQEDNFRNYFEEENGDDGITIEVIE